MESVAYLDTIFEDSNGDHIFHILLIYAVLVTIIIKKHTAQKL